MKENYRLRRNMGAEIWYVRTAGSSIQDSTQSANNRNCSLYTVVSTNCN